MKYVSLFAGIGGFDLALNRLGHECVYANDFDKYCKITYDKNFKLVEATTDTQTKGDIKKPESGRGFREYAYDKSGRYNGELDTRSLKDVPTSDIPDHDILVGGFPCQSFSIAGKRRGFDDTRGTLFFDIARILKDKRPRHFILENVKGLLSHDEGKTFQTILGVLSDLGYEYQWQVLNSKNFGVPQNRERVFIVGHIRGEPRPKVFPIGGSNPKNLEQIIGGGQGNRVYDTNGISTTIASQAGGQGAKTGLYAKRTPLKFLQRNQRKIEGDYSFTVDGANTGGVMIANTIDANYYKGANRNPGHASSNRGYSIQGRIRRLTPLECERLQGFPDNWTEGVSDTQRYKQLGNAVTVNVVYEVAKRL